MKNRATMGVLTREEEKKYRDGVKKVFELGVDSREVELKMKQSAELNAINEGADAKLAGLSDDEASEVMKTSMNSDPDADDYTESKKKENDAGSTWRGGWRQNRSVKISKGAQN